MWKAINENIINTALYTVKCLQFENAQRKSSSAKEDLVYVYSTKIDEWNDAKEKMMLE